MSGSSTSRGFTMIDRDTKRLRKQAERDHRVEELYRLYPRLAELEQGLRRTGIQLAQGALGKIKPGEIERLTRERESLVNAKQQMLDHLNIKPDVFEVHWDCPLCQDRGWADFGVKCACLIQEEIDLAFAQSGLTDEMKNQTFASFDLSWYRGQGSRGPQLADKMEKVLRLCQDFAESIIKNNCKNNLLFYGAVGTGKTHLSSAIANRLVEKRKTVIYRTISQIMTSIYEAKFNFQNQGRHPEVLEALRNVDLVIVDDLGTEKTTDFVVTELFELVNDRLRMGKPMLVSTNVNLSELPGRYNVRIADRLITQSMCVEFEGTSIRQMMFAGR